MNNLFAVWRDLFAAGPLQVGEVIAYDAGIATIQLSGGGILRAGRERPARRDGHCSRRGDEAACHVLFPSCYRFIAIRRPFYDRFMTTV